MALAARSPYQIGHMTTSVPAYLPAFSALVNALNFNVVSIGEGIDLKYNTRAEVLVAITKNFSFRDESGKFRPKPDPEREIPSLPTNGYTSVM